ncbi:asparagine synthase (glutamine-hydrolyzing) [Methanocaldococcus fervens]|uniref:Putative asparagine synthetase [glutamine-hydrolyzing] n=1 Tax=Methanocaldococcus fervens (strain DSM 4213 / JCM 15782 / AG86) TaxID=573064 RepID=C7P6F6_METFA|nr:asparagine synthase (glutamine-hydrolyzing) [Methanocaldococcus fervens]ACV24138.1 asparagine synthase (glutamine-hydrolyzing) [Methanocaldococcus fervens AG86]
MCSISGIIVKENQIPAKYAIEMMKILKHRGKDGSGLLLDDEVVYFEDFKDVEDLEDEMIGNLSLAHNRLAIVGKHGAQPIPNEDEDIWMVCNGEIYNYIELREYLKENHEFRTDTDNEVIIHLYEERMLEEIDGDYAFAIYDKSDNSVLLSRDLFGVKPLFYVDTDKYFAFASERKALWHLLININGYEKDLDKLNGKIKTLKPNSQLIYYLSDNSFEIIENFKKLKLNYMKERSYGEAKKYLDKALKKSVLKRVRGLDKVGIICSGGVDSSLIAKLASLYCEVILYAVGTENSEDLIYAEKLTKDLNLKLRKKIISEEEYESYVFKVAKAIDEVDLMKIGVGIPIYAASEMAKEDGLKVVLSGQGADELFGGYARHERIYKEKGEEELKKELLKDVNNLYKVNLERDDHCTMANGVELRVPFLDEEVVEIALSIPVDYKISELRKKILRDVASQYLPDYIAYRPKKAAQYGSGGEKIIYKVAKKYGFSKKKINEFLEMLKKKIIDEINE